MKRWEKTPIASRKNSIFFCALADRARSLVGQWFSCMRRGHAVIAKNLTRRSFVAHTGGLFAVPTRAEAIGIHPCNRNVWRADPSLHQRRGSLVVRFFFLAGCCMAQRRSLSGRSPFCQPKRSIKHQPRSSLPESAGVGVACSSDG